MTSNRDEFQKNKELAAWWKGIVENPLFSQVQLWVRSDLAFKLESKDAMSGAMLYESTMTGLVDVDPAGPPLPSPGLNHMAEKLPEKPQHD